MKLSYFLGFFLAVLPVNHEIKMIPQERIDDVILLSIKFESNSRRLKQQECKILNEQICSDIDTIRILMKKP